MSNEHKRAAASSALAEITKNAPQQLKIGLGTGSTAWHFVDLLGEKVANGLNCLCVATSLQTAAQAEALNIPLASLDEIGQLDVTVDGADELDGRLNLIKGAGGALLREKIVATASNRMIVIADTSKKVETLGQFALPIEVTTFATATIQQALTRLCQTHQANATLTLRRKSDQSPFVTDGGNYIIDASFGRILAPEKLDQQLSNVPGVVEHGLFIGLATSAYVAGADGVEKIERAD